MPRDPEEQDQPCPAPSPPRSPSDSQRDARVERVGDYLRDIYDEALVEPVPDIFEDLLRKLG